MKRRPPKTLKSKCLETIGPHVTKCIRKTVSNASAASWYGMLHGELDMTAESLIQRQVILLRNYIWSHIIYNDYNEVFKIILKSIENAIHITRKSYKPSCNANQYREEMENVVAFTAIALNTNLRKLDFGEIPTSVRSVIIENLAQFIRLEDLTLRAYASASSQWLFKGVVKDLLVGLQGLNQLQRFSLKHDCTDIILQTVCNNCQWTLASIDIESSKQVSDKSIGAILRCFKLEELHIFHTGITDEGKGRLISNLPNLKHLPRGDFLCDALAWIEEDETYQIQEFFPSQDYYFHEDWQIEMVATCCPYLTKLFFIFHEDCVPDYTVLLPFAYVQDLALYGGHFFDDKISELLLVRGQNITKLTLISVKGVDYKALALLTLHCQKMKSLTLNNCQLVDYQPLGDVDSDEEYERRQAYIAMAREAHEMVGSFESLEEIVISSLLTSLYAVFILRRAPNLKTVNIGPKNEISDETMLKIFVKNPLTHLEEFHCEQSSLLSIMAVNLLISNCDNLKAIGDLQKWAKIDGPELSRFREAIRTENYDLDSSSNQRLRKFLDLREYERKTYLNLVAGPFLERLKMADRQSHTL